MPIARDVREFDVTIPAGTLKTAKFSADISFPPAVVVGVDVRVPPGPRGEVGFQLGSKGVQVVPSNAGAYIVTDDQVVSWDFDGQPDGGSWQLLGYNTGTYDHTLHVTFRLATVPTNTGGSNLPASDLTGFEVVQSA